MSAKTPKMSYDIAYQEWLSAHRHKNYKLADNLREQFERDHGLTIITEGVMPVEEVTVRRMTAAKWHRKYGNPQLAKIFEESRIGPRRVYP